MCGGGLWEISVPSPLFCGEPTVLKKKFLIERKGGWKEGREEKQVEFLILSLLTGRSWKRTGLIPESP